MFLALLIALLLIIGGLTLAFYCFVRAQKGIFLPDMNDIPTPEEIRMATIERVTKLSERRNS